MRVLARACVLAPAVALAAACGGAGTSTYILPVSEDDQAPASLTSSNSFASLSPLLRPSFFVGDGLTGTGSGSVLVVSAL